MGLGVLMGVLMWKWGSRRPPKIGEGGRSATGALSARVVLAVVLRGEKIL